MWLQGCRHGFESGLKSLEDTEKVVRVISDFFLFTGLVLSIVGPTAGLNRFFRAKNG